MARSAIAYVSDVILGTTGDVIGRETQKQSIRQYAAENGIEIVAWFEDEAYNTEILTRDGIRRLLGGPPCDCILVERVWSLSRNWKVLEAFMGEIARRGMKIEAATTLWDCTSQRARHYYSETRKRSRPRALRPERVPAAAAVHIKKPERLFFANLVHRPARA